MKAHSRKDSQSFTNQTQYSATQSQIPKQTKQTQDDEFEYTYLVAKDTSLENYLYHLRFRVFPNAQKHELKEAFRLLFYIKWNDEQVFTRLQESVSTKNIQQLIMALRMMVPNEKEREHTFQNEVKKKEITLQKTKDLNIILDRYLEEAEPFNSHIILRYLLFTDFISYDAFIKAINYLNSPDFDIQFVPKVLYDSYPI